MRDQWAMGKNSKVRHEPPEHLLAWRLSLGLSRQAVVDKMRTLLPAGAKHTDQATLGKWETGETAVRVEDMTLLAEVYGVTPDRLFFPPGDERTPALLQRAYDVLRSMTKSEDVERWLALGEALARKS